MGLVPFDALGWTIAWWGTLGTCAALGVLTAIAWWPRRR
jgi:hypothetical protein